MNGWGRVVCLVTVGLALGAGCGGRTGVPYDEGYDPDPETAGVGGTPSSGGRPSTAVKAGTRATGGRPNPSGGFGGVNPTGGFSTGGSIPVGGFGTAGGFPTGGFSFGGFGGGFPTGGFGGVAGGGPFDCQSCVLQTCSNELLQCFSDFGCLSILGCVQATGCDSFNCYSPDTCGSVIDQWGGPFGPSMNALLETVSCTLTSGCPCN
jgi:hypothetical protein